MKHNTKRNGRNGQRLRFKPATRNTDWLRGTVLTNGNVTLNCILFDIISVFVSTVVLLVSSLTLTEWISPALTSSHWLPVGLVFKALNGLGPNYFNDLLQKYVQESQVFWVRVCTLLQESELNMEKQRLVCYPRPSGTRLKTYLFDAAFGWVHIHTAVWLLSMYFIPVVFISLSLLFKMPFYNVLPLYLFLNVFYFIW